MSTSPGSRVQLTFDQLIAMSRVLADIGDTDFLPRWQEITISAADKGCVDVRFGTHFNWRLDRYGSLRATDWMRRRAYDIGVQSRGEEEPSAIVLGQRVMLLLSRKTIPYYGMAAAEELLRCWRRGAEEAPSDRTEDSAVGDTAVGR